MIFRIQRWYLSVVQLSQRPVCFISLGIAGILLFLTLPNGRLHSHSVPTAHVAIYNGTAESFGVIAKVIVPDLPEKKELPAESVTLNRAKPSTSLPEWQRPLPEEPSAPLLNVRRLPLPEVTSGTLIVPALSLEEPITRVLVRNGRWDISDLNTQVGHLQTTGERPGEGLAMTFVGHTTWPGDGPFAHLNQLQHGQQIIYRWNGYDYIYEIDQMLHVLPTQVGTLYEENGDAIVLATCSGWNSEVSQYDTRLVTRAVLIEKRPAPSPARLAIIS
ncbi:MAG: sortase [Chloroflexota bacterium]